MKPPEAEPTLERPPTLTSAVLNYVKEAVLSGKYMPGTALPEVSLSKQLNTSRGTVREALRGLQDLGLVEIRPHRGAIVGDLSPERAKQIFELRALLEGGATRLAVASGAFGRRMPDDVMAAFRVLEKAEEPFEVLTADLGFHSRITARCGNELLIEHLANLQLQTRRFVLHTKLYESGKANAFLKHRPILDALKTGDPELAEKAVVAHIERAGRELMTRMAAVRSEGDRAQAASAD